MTRFSIQTFQTILRIRGNIQAHAYAMRVPCPAYQSAPTNESESTDRMKLEKYWSFVCCRLEKTVPPDVQQVVTEEEQAEYPQYFGGFGTFEIPGSKDIRSVEERRSKDRARDELGRERVKQYRLELAVLLVYREFRKVVLERFPVNPRSLYVPTSVMRLMMP